MTRRPISIITGLLLAVAAQLPARAITIGAAGAVEAALANSRQLRAAENAEAQARMQRAIARTAYLPDFAASATGAWQLPDTKYPDMGLTMRMRGVYMAGITLQQPIFAGGKIVAANRLAETGVKAAALQLRQQEIAVAADAESAYWTYVATLAKVEMMRAYTAQVDSAMAQVSAAVEAGMATANDRLRVETRRARVAYQAGQVAQGADLCRMALCNAMGIDLDTEITPADEDVPAQLPPDLGVYDPELRPEIRLLRADIEVKRQQMRMTRADFLPTIGLQAGWSAYGNIRMTSMQQAPDGTYFPFTQKINNNGFNIMLSIQVPLFHWGEGYKKVKHARLDIENARLNLDHNARLLDLQVRQAAANVTSGADLVASAEIALRQAETSLHAATEAYRLGLGNLTELLDAQSQWHSARADLIEARTQLRINIIDYQAATATLL